MEGACFVLIASQVVSAEAAKRTNIEGFDYAKLPGGGFSMIYSPFGKELVKALPPDVEGILYADCNLTQRYEAKQNLDIVGHYSRPDQLSLRVNRHGAAPVFFVEEP